MYVRYLLDAYELSGDARLYPVAVTNALRIERNAVDANGFYSRPSRDGSTSGVRPGLISVDGAASKSSHGPPRDAGVLDRFARPLVCPGRPHLDHAGEVAPGSSIRTRSCSSATASPATVASGCATRRRAVRREARGSMMRIRPEWDEATLVSVLTFPEGERVDGGVELGEPVDARSCTGCGVRRAASCPWEERSRAASAGRSSSLGPTTAPSTACRKVGSARCSRARRSDRAARGDGRRRGDRRPALSHALRDRGAAAHEEDDCWAGRCASATRPSSSTATSAGAWSLRRHRQRVVDLTLVTLAGYRREGREEDLPFGVYGAVVVPGRVRVGDIANPLSGDGRVAAPAATN